MLSEINDSLFRIVKEKKEQEKLVRQKRLLTKNLKQAESRFANDETSYLQKYRQLSQLEKARLDKWLPPIGN